VTGNAGNLVWKGGAAGGQTNWDHTTINWSNTVTLANDVFYNGDTVTFDDTARTNAVTVVGSETPASMTMSNNPVAFTFTGAGPLGGSLDVEGAGGLNTIATTNVPIFSIITLNQGVLRFNLANGGANTLASVIQDNGAGNGTFMQAGTNTLLLSGNNVSPGFYGTIAVTNGLLEYATVNALGQYTSALYATNGGTLDVHGVTAGLKNIYASGNGYNGMGALFDTSSGGIVNEGIHNLTLLADTSIGASNRFDITSAPGGGAMNGNGFKLTHNVGTCIIENMGDIQVGDIHVLSGRLGFQGNPVNMGDPAKTITLESNATLTFFSPVYPSNPNGSEDKVMVLKGNTQFDSGGSSNNFQGPITLNGTNNLMGLRQDLHLWGPIGGSGDMSVGNSSVGAGSGTLWLDGANTYTGATVISNAHKIVVGASSSLGSSSPIQVNSGGTLDVTAPSSFTLGAGQVVMGSGTIAGGSVVFGSGSTLAPGFPDGNTYTLTNTGSLTLSSGSTNLVAVKKTTGVANSTVSGPTSVTINSGATLVVNNIGSALAGSDAIQVFTAASGISGTFGTIIPATPGPGLLWSQSTLDTDGMLRVVAIVVTQPDISGIVVGGGDVVLSGTNNGSASTHYVVLSSTNVALPLNQWTPVVTNPFNPDGSFSWTNTIVPAETSRFYRLQLQ
jgi:hypothetical protein